MEGADRHYDVVVVGGASAGLSAALVLGRSRRRTMVLDTGEPRNTPSSGVQSFFSRDGILPKELLRIGREQLTPYPSVELRSARATGARVEDGGFEVSLDDGSNVRARKLLLATGVTDELPEKPGFEQFWGRGIYHCPYCHGWEVRDRPLAVLARGEDALERAPRIRNWSRDVVVCSDGPLGLDEEGRNKLSALGIGVREEKIARLEGGDGLLRRIVFEDGSELVREALFFMPPQRQSSELAEILGCEVGQMGPAPCIVKNDPMTKETTVPGVYVAGDAGSSMQQAILAASSGAMAAISINHALIAEEVARCVLRGFGMR